MGDAGKVDHVGDAVEQRRPVGGSGEVGQGDRGDTRLRRQLGGMAGRRPDLRPRSRQRGGQRPADEAAGAGDENGHAALVRSKVASTALTATAPTATRPAWSEGAGRARLRVASAASTRFSTNTRPTTARTLKPLAVARW